ncbi:hypothetical protein [Spirosoma flavum]|uniref:Capsid protein n=1 Tax=Spirosoma flavum TaxID=2048557 RepID=A0ABW6ANZ9_9BACT
MSIVATTLPDMIANIDNGSEFGQLEKRQSNYGGINMFYNNANKLFGPALIAELRKLPFTRTAKIPIFDKYDHTVLTARSCDIQCNNVNTRTKTLTRTHLAIDICINPTDYENNLAKVDQALKHRYVMAKKAVYKKLDEMSSTFLDLNKDTTMVVDPGGATPNANPLFKSKAGAIEFPSSLKFYAYLQTVLEQLDIDGPYLDIANTVALAEQNILRNPGNGALLDTTALMSGAGITQFDYSNRIAPGVMMPVHYIAPVGSIGVLNMIDLVYQDKPVLGSGDDMDQWSGFANKTELKAWGQTPDEVFNDWDWGVLQELVCVDETILYKVKFSADFMFACDFTSIAGESPIKRVDVAGITY